MTVLVHSSGFGCGTFFFQELQRNSFVRAGVYGFESGEEGTLPDSFDYFIASTQHVTNYPAVCHVGFILPFGPIKIPAAESARISRYALSRLGSN